MDRHEITCVTEKEREKWVGVGLGPMYWEEPYHV